jgi:hypothetical protein
MEFVYAESLYEKVRYLSLLHPSFLFQVLILIRSKGFSGHHLPWRLPSFHQRTVRHFT